VRQTTVHQDDDLEAELAAVTDRLVQRFGDVDAAVVAGHAWSSCSTGT
jgi:hypothetical protein